MRVLGSTMLSLQAVVLLLALPVAISVNGVDGLTATLFLVGTALLAFLAVGAITKKVGLILGWAVQAATLAMGLLVPWLFGLGVVFTGLWWGAIRAAAKIAAVQAAHSQAEPTSSEADADTGTDSDTGPDTITNTDTGTSS